MKTISTFVIAFLIVGFFFLALPEKGYSGAMPFVFPGCCQLEEPIIECGTIGDIEDLNECGGIPFSGEECNEEGMCTGGKVITPIPTLSEWSLIAMAGILGIIGFMVIRRRKVSA